MYGVLCILISFVFAACSSDRPAPVAPAGKISASQEAPGEPENLRVEEVTESSVSVVWDAVEGATDYDVNYKPVSGKWANWPHRGTRLYTTISDLQPETEYRWAVRAENKDGASDWVFGEKFTTANETRTPLISVTPGSPERDREILISIYESSSSDAFKEYTNGTWNTEAPTWYWEGVSTNEEGRVWKLSLRGLDGSIPIELAFLDQLWSLRIDSSENHQLSGDIPMWLWQMESLGELTLYRHNLTGTIPSEIRNLKNLSGLYLRGNQLSGSIPSELGQLKKLRYLDISQNELSGEIPPEIGQLADLRDLDLGFNQLTGSIPVSINQLDSLRSLHLGGNQLTGPIPNEIGQLHSLRHLWLQGNQLTGTIPLSLTQLTSLAGLNLGRNELSGPIPIEFGRLVHLRFLHLEGNELSGPIPLELTNLDSLSSIGLSGNQFSCIPSELLNTTIRNDFKYFRPRVPICD